MRKLSEVEAAKTIMTEAVNWSVMKWLTEKKRVRKAADIANAMLAKVHDEVKASWSDELKAAYASLEKNGGAAKKLDDAVLRLAKRLKVADDEAWQAHLKAEDTFDRAEKILSTALARQGCHEAILSWELKEKAIEGAEAALANKAAG